MQMDNKAVLVTGSTDGIGKQTALTLAQKGARVLIHGRNPNKVEDTVALIQEKVPSAEIQGYTADFSSLENVRDLVGQIIEKEATLDVLVNNAGIYTPDFQRSSEGYELTFTVNHLAPFLLTMSLLPLMKNSTPARIVNVTSIAHSVRELKVDGINDPQSFKGWRAYKLSKFANIVFTYELNRRLVGQDITVNCLHPGAVDTKILNSAFPSMEGISLEEGSRSSVMLATSSELDEVTGKYFENGRPAETAPLTYDLGAQKQIWELSEKMVGLEKSS